MRESNFIRQNKEKWQEFERILENNTRDPEKLNELFIQITDDLSYSRTFYPNRSVRVYLNGLAQKVFLSIYKTKKSRRSRFLLFWTHELPLLIYDSRKAFRFSLILFLLAFLIGAFSSAMDPEFVRIILGDSYVDMTMANIESGDPMAVYKEKGAFGMSVSITANNLFVALLTFVSGVLFAIGTVGIMISNGVMVGAFQYFFVEQELFWESFLTIWTHGTLEISAIIIAGAAGLTMGQGLIFPGTYSRLRAFQLSARRGLKIMLGIAPIIVLAGFIEGYLTRHTETPDAIRLLFILICLGFVLSYFVWYPVYRARRSVSGDFEEPLLSPDSRELIDFTRIKNSGELFSDTFALLRKYFSPIAAWSAVGAILFCIGAFSIGSAPARELIAYPSGTFGSLEALPALFKNEDAFWFPFLHVALFGLLSWKFQQIFRRYLAHQPGEESHWIFGFFKYALIGAALTGLISTMQWYTIFLVIFGFPFLLLWIFTSAHERRPPIEGVGRSFQLLEGRWSRLLSLSLILGFIGLLFFLLLNTTIANLVLSTIGMNFSLEQESMDSLATILLTFITLFILYLVFAIMVIGTGLLYFTLLEIREAPFLRERLEKIGQTKRIRGLERES